MDNETLKRIGLPVLAIESCKLCELHQEACGPLLSHHNTSAKTMMIMSRPQRDDDLIRNPFASIEGKYIKKLLEEAKLIENVYVSYLTKCFSSAKEVGKLYIDQCKGWLWKEIQAVEPEVILTMGRTVSATILSKSFNKLKLSEVVGIPQTVTWSKAKIIPWYEPSIVMNKNHKDNLKFLEKLCLNG